MDIKKHLFLSWIVFVACLALVYFTVPHEYNIPVFIVLAMIFFIYEMVVRVKLRGRG